MKKVVPICCLLLFGGTLLADEWTKRTVVTLDNQVLVAGVPVVTLEPGKYVFKLLNSESDRHIVQIFNEREDHLFTTVLAIANYKLEPKDKSEFIFWETPAGNPPALHAWFFPGDTWGQEFVYPKGLAAKIAKETGEKVLATPAATAEELLATPVIELTNEEEQAIEEAYLEHAVPEEAATETPLTIDLSAAKPIPWTFQWGPGPETLPATASPLYSIGFAGLAGLAVGIGLRRAALAVRKY